MLPATPQAPGRPPAPWRHEPACVTWGSLDGAAAEGTGQLPQAWGLGQTPHIQGPGDLGLWAPVLTGRQPGQALPAHSLEGPRVPHLPAMALVLPWAQQEPQYWGMCWLRVTLA